MDAATAQNPIIVDSFGGDAPQSTGIDPMEIRWAFNGVVREKFLEGLECNIPILPYAKWFAVRLFYTRREFHSTDETLPRETDVIVTAADVQAYLEFALAGKNPNNNSDLGLKFGFVGGPDSTG